jgi:subtilisin family serine protease
MMKHIHTLHLLLVVVLSQSVIAAHAVPMEPGNNYVKDEVLVKFKPSVSAVLREAAVSAGGGAVRATLQRGLTHIKLSAGQSVAASVAAYSSNPNVEYAQPNYIYHEMAVPTDPNYGQQWGFKNTGQTVNGSVGTSGKDMNLEPAWSHITDCSSVVVAVVDSGVNYNHEDLIGNMWNGGTTYPNHGYNYTAEGAPNDPMDKTGHGTHVAGIIGATANNGKGVTGVCWKADIMAVRVLDSTGMGTTVTISQGIDFAVNNGAKAINLSLGGVLTPDSFLSTSLDGAVAAGAVVVVAAGNAANDHSVSGNADYPCDFTHPNLICVTALDQSGALASFSDYGTTSVDVGAPGTNIFSTVAGTKNSLTDPLISMTSWNASGGFASGTATLNSSNTNVDAIGSLILPLYANPSSGSTYNSINNPLVWSNAATASTDARLWQQYDFSPYAAVTLDLFYAVTVSADSLGVGHYAVAYKNSGGDPFAGLTPGATSNVAAYLIGPYTSSNPNYLSRNTLSLNNCLTATCSVGFQLNTGTASNGGLSLVDFTVTTFTASNTAYILKSGTSMAAPFVTGLAAMLRAYNPQYTYTDVVASIKNAGRSTSSLVGKTSTGNAVDAMKSLAYINAPTGLIATVH